MKKSIKNIYCIGRNYSEHAKEMGATPGKEPVVFFKPSSSAISNPSKLELPNFSENIHHEIELIVQLSSDAYKITKNKAKEYIFGYGIGLDLTARDLQKDAKDSGKPWALSKGFYGSAPISEIIPKEKFSQNEIAEGFSLKLKVNGEPRQSGNSNDMIWQISELIEYLSHRFYLLEGDIIFTGTPEGVSQIKSGDKLEAYLNSQKLLGIDIK